MTKDNHSSCLLSLKERKSWQLELIIHKM
jgi:hypothetical protein